MNYKVKEENGIQFIDEGDGEVLLLLHGLFGALSNWDEVINAFSKTHRVVIPVMPIYDMPRKKATVEGLMKFIEDFVKMKGLKDLILLGNSLGGHVGLVYALKNPKMCKAIVLTGSSGLFESSMGGSFPKRGDYKFVKDKVGYTFYDPEVASKALVDEVFEVIGSIPKCLRIVSIAKSAQRSNLATDLKDLNIPTLLIWGLNDTITPPQVAHEFNRLIKNSELHFIDKCCHAPMMEHPERFNKLVKDFLKTRNLT